MLLTASDRRLVRALVPRTAEDVLTTLEERSEVLVAMGGGAAPVPRATELKAALVLAARVLRSVFRQAEACDSIVVERTAASVPARLAYVACFRPGERLRAVTSTTSLAWPGFGTATRALAALLAEVLRPGSSETSEIARRRVGIVTSCLQAAGWARRASRRQAYLFRPYRLESPIVAAFLMERGVDVGVVVGTTPMAAHLRRLVASSAVLCTAYQIDEFAALEPLGRNGAWELWGPTEIVEMQERYTEQALPDLPNVVGVYTQGFWARVEMGSIRAEDAAPHIEHERRFVEVVREYAASHPDVRIVFFPHPMERRRFRETGVHGYGLVLDLPNTSAHFEASNSMLAFDEVGLGLTTVSTIGFDRLHLGLRTLFFTGASDFVDTSIASPFQRLFFGEETEFLGAVERHRTQGHTEFMHDVFGDAYDGVWGPWPAEGESRPAAESEQG